MTITEDHDGEIWVRLTPEEDASIQYADQWERLQESIRLAVEYLQELNSESDNNAY